jgi:hypothetical protein
VSGNTDEPYVVSEGLAHHQDLMRLSASGMDKCNPKQECRWMKVSNAERTRHRRQAAAVQMCSGASNNGVVMAANSNRQDYWKFSLAKYSACCSEVCTTCPYAVPSLMHMPINRGIAAGVAASQMPDHSYGHFACMSSVMSRIRY